MARAGVTDTEVTPAPKEKHINFLNAKLEGFPPPRFPRGLGLAPPLLMGVRNNHRVYRECSGRIWGLVMSVRLSSPEDCQCFKLLL